MAEITLKCIDCGQEFVFTEGEQQFYREKGITPPTRCLICRAIKKAETADWGQYGLKPSDKSGRE